MDSIHSDNIVASIIEIDAASIFNMSRFQWRYVLLHGYTVHTKLLSVNHTSSCWCPNYRPCGFPTQLVIGANKTHLERWIDHFEESSNSHLTKHASCWACLTSGCGHWNIFLDFCRLWHLNILKNGVHDRSCPSMFILWSWCYLCLWAKLIKVLDSWLHENLFLLVILYLFRQI